MKNVASKCFLAVLVLGLMTMQAIAQRTPPPTNPNGFPSGDHFNLNLSGKKAGFACPSLEYDAYNNPIYGNVVFVPEFGTGDIQLNSGSGRQSTGFTTLQVTDPCVAAFDGNPAVVQLPPATDGYWVYARALGKLTDNPSMTITPGIVTVSSSQETLVYLGYVTSTGFYNAMTGVTVQRVKGKHPAIPINNLFDWRGYVCYSADPATIGLEGFSPMSMCLADTDGDGTQEIVGQPVNGVCLEGTLADLFCQYYDTDWVFNIADFVSYLWGIDNDGTKLVQIRFYRR